MNLLTKWLDDLDYADETWNTCLTNTKRLQIFVDKCLRKLLWIKWSDKFEDKK